MGKIERSFTILRESWAILKKDPEMMIFPALATTAFLVITAIYLYPVVSPAITGAYAGGTSQTISEQLKETNYLMLFIYYVLLYFVMYFFQTGLVACALKRLSGVDPTLRDGFQIATENLGRVFAWSLVAATFGILMQFLEKVRLGSILTAIAGLAWNIVTFMVVPVLIVEKVGPIVAIKRSAALLKQTWGERLVGGGSIGIALLLASLAGIIPILIGIMMPPIFMITGVAIAVVYWLALGVIATTLGGIYNAALYQYATTNEVPSGFSSETIHTAFKTK